MLNCIVRNRTVWSFNCVYLQNMLTNRTFNINVKIGFVTEWPAMVDLPLNQTKPNQTKKKKNVRTQNNHRVVNWSINCFTVKSFKCIAQI